MKNSLKVALVAALVSLGCHSKESLNREQQNYQVVQEGSASGVTSTVGAPGEGSISQAPPITGTNADTTTAFALASNGVPQQVPTSTAPMMPPPNVGAGGAPVNATMPNYAIPPGLARNIGQPSSSSTARSTPVHRTAPRQTPAQTAAQPMTSAVEHSTPASTTTTAPAETTASTPPATETPAPHKAEEKPAAPAPAPAEEAAPAEEPSTEAPPATQTGTFGPR